MQTIYDLTTQKLPPYQAFGNAVIGGRVYILAMARMTPNTQPTPLVICLDRGLAWQGDWEFLVEKANEAISKEVPTH